MDGAGSGEGPRIRRDLRAASRAGRSTLHAFAETATAMRDLVIADARLAYAAMLRGLALSAIAIVLGWVAWIFVMAVAALALVAAGLGWLASVAIVTGFTVLCAVLAAWGAKRMFALAQLSTARRHLTALFGEIED